MLWLWITIVYAATWKTVYLSHDTANWSWSNDSKIEFSVVPDWNNFATYYTNKEDNSSIIWNYFKGYYYDSAYWYFKLDWSSDKSKNVRIVDSTDKCNWYWYKLWWYAYSEDFWFIDFSYDDSHFVYYCVLDKELHWYAYLDKIWFQNFDWIWFEIAPQVDSDTGVVESDDFVNDKTEITNPYYENEDDVIWWNVQYIKDTKWSVFYIIK
jgi:hypothetical protein